MKESDKSWNFIRKCSQGQIQLLKETLDMNLEGNMQQTPSEVKLLQNINRRNDAESVIGALAFTEDGEVISYDAFLRSILETLYGEKSRVLSGTLGSIEDSILLFCLEKTASKYPLLFKKIYNLAASTSEDVVSELKIRFETSEALRCSLPVVLVALYTKDKKLSKVAKNAINDWLETLNITSSLGTYSLLDSFSTILTAAAVAVPIAVPLVGLLAVGLALLKANIRPNMVTVCCVLIMLRRQRRLVSSRRAAIATVDSLISLSVTDVAKSNVATQTSEVILAIFLKMLQIKDSSRYMKVSGFFSEFLKKENLLTDKAAPVLASLLPYAEDLVIVFYHRLWRSGDNSAMSKFLKDEKLHLKGKKCLAQGFVPDMLKFYPNVHFLVDKLEIAKASLCIELMGRNSSALCKTYSALVGKYDIIILKNDNWEKKCLSFIAKGGQIICLDKLFNKRLSLEAIEAQKALRLENEELKKKLQIWEIAAHSFRHSRMTGFIGRMQDALDYIDEDVNIKQNIDEIKTLLQEMGRYVDEFGKHKVQTYDLWNLLQESFKGKEVSYQVRWCNKCLNTPKVVLNNLFEEWVLENIKSNILRHAFPSDRYFDNPTVWITLSENTDSYVLDICNNGAEFKGDLGNMFKKGVSSGNTAHTGEGLFYAKMYFEDFLKKGQIDILPGCEKYSIGFRIKIFK